MQLEEVLYNIFFSYINCSSQGRTVILLEKVFTDRRIIEAACKILFKKLKIERVELALSCITPLYLTGRYSGLVISAGASAVELMAIYDGYPLFTSYKCISTGTQALNRLIRDEIALLNKDLSLEMLKQITDDEINEQIKNQYCSVNASSNPVTIAIKNKLRIKWVPDKVNFNIFFGNSEN
jgi:actin-related protein